MHAVPYKSCRHYTAPTVFSYRASLQHFVYKDEVNDEAVMLSSHIYFGTSTHICCPSIWL